MDIDISYFNQFCSCICAKFKDMDFYQTALSRSYGGTYTFPPSFFRTHVTFHCVYVYTL